MLDHLQGHQVFGMFGFVSRYHPTWRIPIEVYVMADTNRLRVMLMRIR